MPELRCKSVGTISGKTFVLNKTHNYHSDVKDELARLLLVVLSSWELARLLLVVLSSWFSEYIR